MVIPGEQFSLYFITLHAHHHRDLRALQIQDKIRIYTCTKFEEKLIKTKVVRRWNVILVMVNAINGNIQRIQEENNFSTVHHVLVQHEQLGFRKMLNRFGYDQYFDDLRNDNDTIEVHPPYILSPIHISEPT